MKHLLKLLQPLMFFFSLNAFAAENSILISQKFSEMPTFAFSKNDYDDVRVVSGASVWLLKKGDVEITAKYFGRQIDFIQIKRFVGKEIIEAEYRLNSKSRLQLSFFSKRAMEVYNYTAFETPPTQSTCVLQQQATSRLDNLKDALSRNVMIDNLNGFILDKSCNDPIVNPSGRDDRAPMESYPNFKGDLVSQISSITNISSRTGKYTNFFSSCLEDPKNQEQFNGIIPDYKNVLNIIAAKYNLELAKMYEGSSQVKPMIKCQFLAERNATTHCAENGTITFIRPKDSKAAPNFKKQFVHEMSHRIGVKDDQLVDNLVNLCFDKIRPTKGKSNSEDGKRVIPLLSATTPPAPKSVVVAQDSVNRAPASVPKEITPESIGIPPANEIAQPVVTANSATSEGVQRAEAQSYAQSGPLFNFANLVTGATQPASATTLASNTTTTSSTTSRSTSYSTPGTSGASSSGLKPGERVVEEINISDRKVAAAAGGARSVGVEAPENKVSAPTSGIAAPTAGITNETLAAAGVKTFPTGTSGKGSASTPSAGGDPFLAAANSAAANAPAAAEDQPTQARTRSANSNRTPSSIGPGTIASREELTTFILSSEYRSARQRLMDPKIQAGLVKNDITVMDLKGNKFGATRGSVIILDQGDRFVRQK